MCVIFYKPKGVDFKESSFFDRAMKRNPDGFGFYKDGSVYKSLDKNEMKETIESFMKAPSWKDSLFVFHARLATHGSIRLQNCHPFVDKETGLLLFHNGVLHYPSIDDKTDSEYFFRNVYIPAYKKKNLAQYAKVTRETDNSRIIVLDMKNNEVYDMFGFWNEWKKCFVSNMLCCYKHTNGGVYE